MDKLTDFDNLDVMIGSENANPMEKELTNDIEESSVQGDPEANMYSRNEFRNHTCEIDNPRLNETRESIEHFANEFNLRLSQEMDSMVALMHTQINEAISSAISYRVIPEICSIVISMSSSGNRDTEASSSPNSQGNRENDFGMKTKITKKDSRSACYLRNTETVSSYTVSDVNNESVRISYVRTDPSEYSFLIFLFRTKRNHDQRNTNPRLGELIVRSR